MHFFFNLLIKFSLDYIIIVNIHFLFIFLKSKLNFIVIAVKTIGIYFIKLCNLINSLCIFFVATVAATAASC